MTPIVPVQGWYGACTRPVWFLYKAGTAPVQGRHGACTRPVWCLYKAGTAPVQGRYGACTRPVRCLYKAGTAPVEGRYGACTRPGWCQVSAGLLLNTATPVGAKLVPGYCTGCRWAIKIYRFVYLLILQIKNFQCKV